MSPEHLRRRFRLRAPRVLARKQDALPPVLGLVCGGNASQDILVDVQVVVGAEDVGFRQRAAAVGRRDTVEVVDARSDAIVLHRGKSSGVGRREGREVVFEGVDVVDV